MTLKDLIEITQKYDIPQNATLMSDSGWECCATDMDGAYYNAGTNTIVFTQELDVNDVYFKSPDWRVIYGKIPYYQTLPVGMVEIDGEYLICEIQRSNSETKLATVDIDFDAKPKTMDEYLDSIDISRELEIMAKYEAEQERQKYQAVAENFWNFLNEKCKEDD